MQCTAKSKQSGKRCKQHAIPGGEVCRFHGGAAPQVKAKAEERLEATRERVLLELCRLAYVDPRALFEQVTTTLEPAEGDKKGKPQQITSIRLRAITELEPDVARTIKSVHFNEFGEISSVRLIDKKGALDSIAKSLGMFKETVEHTGADGKPIQHTVRVLFVKPRHGADSSKNPAHAGSRPAPAK